MIKLYNLEFSKFGNKKYHQTPALEQEKSFDSYILLLEIWGER